MRTIIWAGIALGIAVWSGLAWLAHGLVGWGGNLASSNVDLVPVDPESIELFSWLAVFGTDVAQWLVIAVWFMGTALLLVLGLMGRKLGAGLGGLASRIKVPT